MTTDSHGTSPSNVILLRSNITEHLVGARQSGGLRNDSSVAGWQQDRCSVNKRAYLPARSDNGPGTPLVATRDAFISSSFADLSNVVPFARSDRHVGKTPAFPLPAITVEDRPAPSLPGSSVYLRVAVLAASLMMHGALLAIFWNTPVPVASIGTEIISIQVTLGATTAAGLAAVPSEHEVQVAVPAEDQKPQESATDPTSVIATALPQDVPIAPRETTLEVKEQKPEIPTSEQRPQEQQAEIATEHPVPQIKTAVTADEQRRIDAPTREELVNKQNAAAVPTDAASGVGRGRSDLSANYDGSVAAHLTRHKQYPVAARKARAQGVATVTFTVDSSGRVTSVKLESSSGIAPIDHEVVAMVRRASPFPAPPDGQARNFTVPVRFSLR